MSGSKALWFHDLDRMEDAWGASTARTNRFGGVFLSVAQQRGADVYEADGEINAAFENAILTVESLDPMECERHPEVTWLDTGATMELWGDGLRPVL